LRAARISKSEGMATFEAAATLAQLDPLYT
jgi:hypothetical protein